MMSRLFSIGAGIRQGVLFCLALLLPLCWTQWAVADESTAFRLPQEVLVNGVEFVLIPQGWFYYTVGSGQLPEKPKNIPMHWDVRVWLDDFYLAKYEARASDLARFLNSSPVGREIMALQEADASLRPNGRLFPDKACTLRLDSDGVYHVSDPSLDLPATYVSRLMADEFSRWMGFRLPIEAEWEKAARGPEPERRLWPWGDAYPDDTYANFYQGSDCRPVPVNAYPRGRSFYGVFNLLGNVGEIVADWYSPAADAELKDGVRNPVPLLVAGPPFYMSADGPTMMVKGGNWNNGSSLLHIAQRNTEISFYATIRYGVRFAIDSAVVREHLARGTAKVLSGADSLKTALSGKRSTAAEASKVPK